MHMHAYNSFTNNTFDCMHSLLRKSDLKENILHNTKIQTLNLKVHNITKKIHTYKYAHTYAHG